MKKISEMTLAELQDYALSLEGEKATLETQLSEANATADELRETNLLLQDRNNKLFMQVEQGMRSVDEDPEDPEEVETCEQFAFKNLESIMKGN